MRSLSPALLLLAASACYSEADYRQDINTARCEWYEACGYLETLGYDAVSDCVDEYALKDQLDAEEGIAVCEDFDADKARACVEGWQTLDCAISEEDYPAECDAVCAR